MAEKHIVAKPIHPTSSRKLKKREIYAEICYFYPQYKLAEVAKLPARDIRLLAETARRLQARDYFEFVQIAAAPHTEKGKGVKELSDRYSEDMKG